MILKSSDTCEVNYGDAAARKTGKRRKQGIFKNCAPSTNCIRQIDITEADNV